MTYKLNPNIKMILSPIILVFPEGNRACYPNGKAAKDASFEKPYQIETLKAIEKSIEVTLRERRIEDLTWHGEEAASFF